jgi:hypothetical protein
MEQGKTYSFGAASQKALVGVHPNLVKVLTAAITHSPVDFSINEGVRSLAKQKNIIPGVVPSLIPIPGPCRANPLAVQIPMPMA